MKSNEDHASTPIEPSQDLAQAVNAAANCPALLAQLQLVLAQADEDLAKLAPSCDACGKCCRFDRAEHRLFASSAEIAFLLQKPAQKPKVLRCPYQSRNNCIARKNRPLGCRVYYCRVGNDLLSPIYENYHHKIKLLHRRHSVGYHYVEMTSALVHLL